MSPKQIQQLSGLYHAALALEPHQRESFLQEACCGDEVLLEELKHLLAANAEAGSFLAEPVVSAAANSITKEKESAMIGRNFGHYRILSHLGTGGMGEVYLATDEKLGRKVAIKLLPVVFADSPERLRRFIREARAASATDHPNIVTIHEIGEQDGIHYIAEEFVEGETLRSLIERGPVPVFDALNIAHQIANAMSAAHSAGIVHRDIKPENIMLRPDGFVKVLDFGLAGMTQPETVSGIDSKIATMPANTAPGVILGTVNYMSPEQTRGQKVDARSDLWSLGVVLYEMLTGQRPFHGESIPDVFVAILERQPTPLAQSMADPSPELGQIVEKLLAKKREHRYQSSAQLAAELKRFHHRLELDAERDASRASNSATLFIQPQTATASPAPQELPLSPATLPPLTDPVTKELAKVARLSRATIGLALFLTVALIAAASWWAIQQKAPAVVPATSTERLPERSFSYWLTVQRMRDGKPDRAEFQSSGRDFYESGWRFRFNFVSPQSGYLYLINEGPTENGISHWLLFPMPSVNEASAKIERGQPMTTNWFTFTKDAGDEKIWVVWAAKPISELEEIKTAVLNPQEKGEVRGLQQRNTVRRLLTTLNKLKPEDQEDRVKLQTSVTGRGDSLIHLVDLRHH